METFQAALDDHVECVRAADPSDEAFRLHANGLAHRVAGAAAYLGDDDAAALERVRSHRE